MQDDVHHLLIQRSFKRSAKIGHIADDSVASDGMSPIDWRSLTPCPFQQMRERHVAEHHAVVVACDELKFDMRVGMCLTFF